MPWGCVGARRDLRFLAGVRQRNEDEGSSHPLGRPPKNDRDWAGPSTPRLSSHSFRYARSRLSPRPQACSSNWQRSEILVRLPESGPVRRQLWVRNELSANVVEGPLLKLNGPGTYVRVVPLGSAAAQALARQALCTTIGQTVDLVPEAGCELQLQLHWLSRAFGPSPMGERPVLSAGRT
jgi:hypothetical protein